MRSYTDTGGIVCEDDDSGANSVDFLTVFEVMTSSVLDLFSYRGVAECGDGYSVTGGGYRDLGLGGLASVLSLLHENFPENGTKWRVHLEADLFHVFNVYARCLRIE